MVRQPLTPLSRDSGELVHPIKRRRQVRLYRVKTEYARLLGIVDIRPDLVVRFVPSGGAWNLRSAG